MKKSLLALVIFVALPSLQAMDFELKDLQLLFAIQQGNIEEAKKIITTELNSLVSLTMYSLFPGKWISCEAHFLEKSLSYSAGEGRVELFEWLLLDYPLQSLQIIQTKTGPLWNACSGGSLKIVKTIVERGAKINGCPNFVPLVQATQKGHSQVVKYLIEQGANISKREVLGKTALDIAIEKKNYEMMHILLTTIPEHRNEQLQERVSSIKTGLLAVMRSELIKDVRKIIARLILDPLIDDHMDYANQLLESTDSSIQDRFKTPESWQSVRLDVENNIRQILFKNVQDN